jgi:cytochrome c biogenesis protein CcdA/thiol-disulfide isomerase/thioredoxin
VKVSWARLSILGVIILLIIPPFVFAQSSGDFQPSPDSTPTPQSDIDDGVCRPDDEECGDIDLSGIAPTLAPDLFGTAPSADDWVKLTGDGVVRLVFVWAEDCPHCHEVMETVLPSLVDKYGDQLSIAMLETSQDPARYEIYLEAIGLYNIAPARQGWPAVLIGDTHLLGSHEIQESLEGLIQRYLDEGGVDYPPLTGLEYITGEAASLRDAEEGADAAASPPIHLAYFYQTGCQDCDRVKGDLNYLQGKFPQMVVEEFNVRDSAALSEWMSERVGVPESHRLTAPTVFIGQDYLLEEQLDARSLEDLLNAYVPDGAERFWTHWEDVAGEQAEQGIVERFQSLGVFTIVFAGLVDGLNPCAFATLVFFVSYLTISGRKGKDVLSVGAAFTLGVFLAYMLVGVGFYRALDMLGDLLTTLGRWLYALTAIFCLVLAAVSFSDYLKARRGEIGEMTLNLPHRLRMQINAFIRKSRKSSAFVAAAFVTGVVVSFLELACTGQVYLPTIIFVMSVPELKAQALFFLFLYNLLFVLPLVIVFFLAYYGTGAKQFSSFLQQRASTVKLGMAFLFLALGSWLAVSLI